VEIAFATSPPGMLPKLISDRPNVASWAAMAMSDDATIVNAPPKQ